MQVRPHEPVCSQSALRAPHHPRGRGEVIGGIKRADAQLRGGRGSPACNLACTIATVRGRGDSPNPLQPLLFYPFALLHSTLHFFQSAIFSGATQNPARVIMRVRKNNIEQSRSSSLWLNFFFSCDKLWSNHVRGFSVGKWDFSETCFIIDHIRYMTFIN